MNPCNNCKKHGKCPQKCYPKIDYIRHMRKKKKHSKEGKHGQTDGRQG